MLPAFGKLTDFAQALRCSPSPIEINGQTRHILPWRGENQVVTLDEKITAPCGLSPDGRLFAYLADYFEVPSVKAYDLASGKTISLDQSKQKENARQISCPAWLPAASAL